jgi:hypothetical protein
VDSTYSGVGQRGRKRTEIEPEKRGKRKVIARGVKLSKQSEIDIRRIREKEEEG